MLPTVKLRRRSRVVLPLVYAAFISLGLPDGILGAAWPEMRVHFEAALNDNWPILTLGICGGLLSSFLSGAILRRLGTGRVLVLTALLTGGAILGYAISPSLAAITVLAFLLGLGNGAADAGLNSFVANHLSSRHMNWLHACWGVGVSLGTLIISAAFAVGHTWRTAYLIVGALQWSLAAAFVLNFRSLATSSDPVRADDRNEPPTLLATLALPATWTSMAAFFVYCGVEFGSGLWIASVLHDARGWTKEASGLMVTVYWGSLTIGRFLMGTVSHWTTPVRIVRAAVLSVIAGTALIAWSSVFGGVTSAGGWLMALGLLVTGLGLSPIFPMLMHDTPRCVGRGHALNLIGFQSGAGALGCAILPSIMGTVMRFGSAEWLGSMLVGLSVTMFILVMLRERHACRGAPASLSCE
jgi:fucose permease